MVERGSVPVVGGVAVTVDRVVVGTTMADVVAEAGTI